MKRIAVLGAGFVSKPAVDYFIDRCGYEVVVTYPSQDCTEYLKSFELTEDASLFRGILRFPGWCNTMSGSE